MTHWTVKLEEDPETGDAVIKFPEDLLAVTGWQEGDVLSWEDLGNGSWSLTKKTEPSKIQT